MKVGFVGVGAMGLFMAKHMISNGHEVFAFDTSGEALERAAAAGVTPVENILEMSRRATIFIVMVISDEQSTSVTKQLLECGLNKDCIIVVTATNHPKTMIELAALCKVHNVEFVDAPVCYGLKGAENGELISLCGGHGETIEKLRPLLMSYSRSVEHIGGHGAGQLGKTCNNMMHWAACVANYETLALAKAYGIDAQAMRETLLKCPARNTTLERWDSTKFTWHEKDMDVALQLSQDAELTLPLFGLVDQLVKTLGPDDVKALLYGETAKYLGQPIKVNAENLKKV